ncbi:M56 family metallopeptidase [Winogradskyella bathintestinalis]|uniref:M56 family metallopeptidase n=1 Tax=Winogradskyella bathintestinalis TaxID=3035208 RepID=A0ABT7ZQD9_9FLAO|nr:M56 family metallopeptidase [Winogradskyella bathintestinalis]MDN3491232.1 M56 family metallopeptidase [Winogradskyella bathintestinalis]
METYIFKFSVCLLVFWAVYILLLERQNMHRFKRFYLLGAVVTALIIPVLSITNYIEPEIAGIEVSSVIIPTDTSLVELPKEQDPFLDFATVFWVIYSLGLLLFTIRFIINLSKMYKHISANETITEKPFIYVLLEECKIPHSFFKYIFFNKLKFESDVIPKEVILHEETHAKQLHSLDIIALELLQIVLWFHPLIYIFKHHIKLNHEFLADQAVLKQGVNIKSYQNILLQFSSSTQNYQLSSAINYSSIKKRFTVMKTQTSKTRIGISTLLLLPIIAILFYSFAERVEVAKEQSYDMASINNDFNEDKTLQIEDLDQKIVEIYVKKYNAYENLRNTKPHYIHKSRSQQKELDALFSELSSLYSRMSVANQDKVKRTSPPISPYVQITLNGKTYYKKHEALTNEEKATLPPPPPPPSFSNQENNENAGQILKSLDDEINVVKPIMVILINRNGQLLIDDKLGSLEDIETKLQTLKKTFDHNRAIYVRYDPSEASEKVLKVVGSSIKEYDFKVIHADASQDIPPPPPTAYKKDKDGPNLTDSDHYPIPPTNMQEKASANQVAAYNDWAKQLNSTDNKIIKKTDLKKYTHIYRIMSAEQKKTAEAFPKLPPPPPPPTKVAPYKNGKKKTLSEIIKETPKGVMSGYELLENGKSHYYTVHNGKKTYYNKDGYITDNKGKVLPPPPPPPTKAAQYKNGKKKTLNEIIKETPKGVMSGYQILDNGQSHYYTIHNGKKTYYNKDGYITDKKGKVLPPPPPPPSTNPSFLEYIIDMEKQGASFYLDGKKITAKEAKAIAKNNKGKNTDMVTQLDANGKYVVKLSNPKD